MAELRSQSGFSMLELLVATALLLIVSSIVTQALVQMTSSQKTIWNRTEMHSGIRGATELLQQEVGQAGRISLPGPISLVNAITGSGTDTCNPDDQTINPQYPQISAPLVNGVNPLSYVFASTTPTKSYELLTTLDGDSQESFVVFAVDLSTSTIKACFAKDHAAGTVLTPLGAFGSGIIPTTVTTPNGSTDTVLKLYGDVNGDGNMVYVEYTCDWAVSHNLYRNVMAFNATSKPMLSDSQILLSNIQQNPGGTACFTYQTITKTVQGIPLTFVLDVAVTLTVQTQDIDPITKQYQTETKALLNVSPRNVFNAYQLAGIGYTDRIQSTPSTVKALLP